MNKENTIVKKFILDELKKWYDNAISLKKEGKEKGSHFLIGTLCHTIQDSFVLSHCWRRYMRDHRFTGLPKIDKCDKGKIWTFQDYQAQDGNYHAFADSPFQKNVLTIGYRSAEEATKQILIRYAKGLGWEESENGGYSSPKDYLSSKYEICKDRGDKPSGGSHPWFKKNGTLSIERMKNLLYLFSEEIEECP